MNSRSFLLLNSLFLCVTSTPLQNFTGMFIVTISANSSAKIIINSSVDTQEVSCQAFLCKKPNNNSGCIARIVEKGKHAVILSELKDSVGRYYANVLCGSKPLGDWIPIGMQSRSVQKHTGEVGERRSGVTVTSVRINMKISSVGRMLLIWNIEMKSGEPFMTSSVKNFEIRRHNKKWNGDYDGGISLTWDINSNVIDEGVSPGYKFAWTCYLYSIDVTFRSGERIREEAEKCFSLSSPSFALLFGFLAITAVICARVRLGVEDADQSDKAAKKFRKMQY